MSKDLYPTKTRLALLREVADGRIMLGAGGIAYGGPCYSVVTGRTVTARIAEMFHAGWVEPAEGTEGGYWSLTDAGRAVLDGAK